MGAVDGITMVITLRSREVCRQQDPPPGRETPPGHQHHHLSGDCCLRPDVFRVGRRIRQVQSQTGAIVSAIAAGKMKFCDINQQFDQLFSFCMSFLSVYI